VIDEFELDFNLGNVVKYVLRADRHGDRVGDLRKAVFYLERELKKEKQCSSRKPGTSA
jgi:hypothetical protein